MVDNGTPLSTKPCESLVQQRSVFLMGGYEPKSTGAFFSRTRRELARFCDNWNVTAELGEQTISEDGLVATAIARADMRDGNQKTKTAIHFFVWNDLVLRDFSKPIVVRIGKYLLTFLDYMISGTFFRITRHAWRFAIYFLYPILMLVGFGLVSWFFGSLIATLSLRQAPAAGVLLGFVIFLCLLKGLGGRWFVLHLMDLWSFSRSYLRGRRPDALAYIDRFAEAIVQQARSGNDDEIILVGHSTGGALILEIAAAALRKEPELGKHGPRVTLVTLGSTALKIGLHPAAVRFRKHVQSLVDAHAIGWIECQALSDLVNFYKTDPVAIMGLANNRSVACPQVHILRLRDMLQPEIYKRFRYNFFRLHYQFIMANTKRYGYDFFMMCCGNRFFAEHLGTLGLFHPKLTAERRGAS